MTDKAKLLDAFLDLIASAVVDKLKAEGGTIGAPADDAPADDAPPPKTAKAKPAATGKAPKKVDRDAVYAEVKKLGERDGKPAARQLIAVYAPSFGNVADDDLPKLLKDVKAALAVEPEETADEEEEDL